VSSREKKPKNRFEGLVKPAFKEAIEYLKDAYDAIGIDEISFKTGPPIVRAFYQDLKKDERKAKQKYPDLYRKWKKGEDLYNKGGTVMKDQMQMAFMQEGGLRDDGMDVDPVSGNEVPPGSMASEVRDDIPAQLSEGEYVVPADVVQYYGVKFFEELRMDAKRGLADMESNGRIGGEPMDMPRDMPMDGMNQGGMMQGNEQTMPVDTGVGYNVGGMTSNPYNNPTKMDQQVSNVMADNPQNMDMQNRTQAMMSPEQMDQANPPPPPRGMNTGGVVPMPPYNVAGLTANQASGYDYVTNPFNPSTGLNPIFATPGATYMAPPSPSQMVPPTGGVDSSVPSEENCAKMGMDFDPVANMCVPRAAAQTPQQGGGSGNDDPGANLENMPKPKPWYDGVNWEDPTAQMESYFGSTESKIGSAIAGVAGSAIGGPLVGGAMAYAPKVSNLANARAMVNIYEAMGMTDEAAIVNNEINKVLKNSKALGLADKAIDSVFGSDGDIKTISGLRNAGIDVDKSLRDEELDEFLKELKNNREAMRKLRETYAPEAAEVVEESKITEATPEQKAEFEQKNKAAEEAAQKIISSGSRNDDGGKTALERHNEIRAAAEKSGASKGQAASTAAKVITKDLTEDEKTGADGGAGLGDAYGITGLKKGGLMTKKKKKK